MELLGRMYPKLINKDSSDDLATDLENWMSKLPQQLRAIPIIYLAIPGTHDSFTSNITSASQVSPDADEIWKKLESLICVRHIMAQWSRTQAYLVTEQLKAGIRYFDLRLTTKTGDDKLYFCHGLYGEEVQSVLGDMAAFLETHTNEVIILDCQHFYAFTQDTHEKLMQMIENTFGTKLLPYSEHMDLLTLEYMTTQFRYQVIVIYRSDASRFGQPLLWPSASFPNPWADTDVPTTLFSALDSGLKSRNTTVGFITQCILTPSTTFVIRNLCSDLQKKCAVDLEEERTGWISKQTPGKSGKFNVVIADFVDLSDNLFAKTVINLNQKLLNMSPKSPTFLYPVLHVENEIGRY